MSFDPTNLNNFLNELNTLCKKYGFEIQANDDTLDIYVEPEPEPYIATPYKYDYTPLLPIAWIE